MSGKQGRKIRPDISSAAMNGDSPFNGWAASVLKRAIAENGLSYQDLSERLQSHDISMSPTVLNRRINRGNFSGDFLLFCLYLLGVTTIRLDGIRDTELTYESEVSQEVSPAFALEQVLGFRR